MAWMSKYIPWLFIHVIIFHTLNLKLIEVEWCIYTYQHTYIIPTLLRIMACRLVGAKPLSEPMLSYCQSDHKEHISMTFSLKFESFLSRKCAWICRLWTGSDFVSTPMCWLIPISKICIWRHWAVNLVHAKLFWKSVWWKSMWWICISYHSSKLKKSIIC